MDELIQWLLDVYASLVNPEADAGPVADPNG